MEIRLNRLVLQNFQGLQSFVLDANGEDITIRGDNATGKTTLANSFHWLLFGKSLEGRTDFEVKPHDTSGLDTSVEAVLSVDGQALVLKKLYKEKWTKKRGDLKATLTGHTTDHFVDGVPVQKKEWDAKIGELVPEETFRLLTNPHHFAGLHWQKRRAILLEVCGDISDEAVIKDNPNLAGLLSMLNGKALADFRKIVDARRKEVNKAIADIPPRIDELSRSLEVAQAHDLKDLQAQAKALEEKIQNAKAGSGEFDNRREIAKLKAELQEAINKDQADRGKRRAAIREQINKVDTCISRLRPQETASFRAELDRAEKEIEALRAKWFEVNEAKIEAVKESCPSCGRPLPKEQVEAAVAKAKQARAEKLKHIQDSGTAKKARADEIRAAIIEFEAQNEKALAEKSQLTDELATLSKKMAEAETKPTMYTDEISRLKSAIAKAEQAPKPEVEQEPDTVIDEANLQTIRGRIAKVQVAQDAKKRIQELKNEERRLAGKYETLENQLGLCDQFVVAKVSALEGAINGKFELARFRLFEEQINGGTAETCLITDKDGVPLGFGLNNAASINLGLDIIRTLSAHYSQFCPVFIDNAEAVTELVNPGTQTIRLYVAEGVKELEVQHGGK